MKASAILTILGFAGISLGTSNNLRGWLLWIGIWLLYVSLDLKKEDK